jgi:ribonuclease D
LPVKMDFFLGISQMKSKASSEMKSAHDVSTLAKSVTKTKRENAIQIESPFLRPILPEMGTIPLLEGDVAKTFVDAAREQGNVAWDIETSGLDWRSERIGLCQVWVKEQGLGIVKIRSNRKPRNLISILEDSSVCKIFHHAMFDLRFLCYHWNVRVENVVCTKIASKLLDPDRIQNHTLAGLLKQYLDVTIDKSRRKSDWLSWALSQDQIAYAGDDVIHLPKLFDTLMAELNTRSLAQLAQRCFAHIPTQVQLEIRGYRDIYGY